MNRFTVSMPPLGSHLAAEGSTGCCVYCLCLTACDLPGLRLAQGIPDLMSVVVLVNTFFLKNQTDGMLSRSHD